MENTTRPFISERGTVVLYGTETWNEHELPDALSQIRRRWQDWHIVMFVDHRSLRVEKACRRLAWELGIEVRAHPGHGVTDYGVS